MKKILATSLVCVFFLVFFCGCSDALTEANEFLVERQKQGEFSEAVAGELVAKCVLDHDNSVFYYRDGITDVMYLIYDGYRAGGLTIMLKPDGTPLLYDEWIEGLP